MLYPILFEPIFKTHVWGGRKIERLYHKPLPPDAPIGESWEVADRPEGVSVIGNGPLAGKDLRWLMEHHAAELLGQAKATHGRFPLLAKILDCHQAPSLQVHPRADMAERLGGEPKTEIWYVTDAAAGAHLYAGLRREMKRGLFERKLSEDSIVDCLHRIPVRTGDAMFVPSGRVHSIGAGTVVFEIQQNSNTTYRVFDWGRVGTDGKPRELHVEQALAAIDFDDFEPTLVQAAFEERGGAQTRQLVYGPWFAAEEWRVPSAYREDLGALDRPLLLAVVAGALVVRHPASGITISLAPGQFCLVPACVADAVLEAEASTTYLLVEPGLETEPEFTPGTAEAFGQAERDVRPPWEAYETHRRRRSGDRRRGTIPSRRRIKRELSRRLTYSPFLKIVVLNPWFRLAVLALALVGLLAAITLPKMWRVSPSGFAPVVRISLVDKFQSFMLRRTAVAARARGHPDEAARAYRNAFANDMGDPDLARGLIESILAQEVPAANTLPAAVQTSDWLLRLTHTNRTDLDLVVHFFDTVQLYDQVYELLQPIAGELTGTLKSRYVKALFFESQLKEFDDAWKQLPAEQQALPDLALVRAGYLAGWGPAETAVEGRERLAQTAVERGPLQVLANRLQLAVSAYRSDVVTFGQALNRLQEAGVDTGIDHAGYWRLLAGTGRKAEAVRMATDYVLPPHTPTELLRLARGYASLGMQTEALKLLKRYAEGFGYSEGVWTSYAILLVEAGDWETLRGVALQMRRFPSLRGRLDALSYYYEGRADLGTARLTEAKACFERASTSDYGSPVEAMAAASSMLSLGYPAQARTLLLRVRNAVTDRLAYLDLAFKAAIQLKDGPLLLETSHAEYQLQPRNADSVNRYAAALIIDGKRPDEAIRVSRELYAQFPNVPAIRINHSLALLLNRRPSEAEEILRSLAPDRLRAEEANSYRLAWFELYAQQEKFAEAAKALEGLDLNELFPEELRRVAAQRARLPAPSPKPAP